MAARPSRLQGRDHQRLQRDCGTHASRHRRRPGGGGRPGTQGGRGHRYDGRGLSPRPACCARARPGHHGRDRRVGAAGACGSRSNWACSTIRIAAAARRNPPRHYAAPATGARRGCPRHRDAEKRRRNPAAHSRSIASERQGFVGVFQHHYRARGDAPRKLPPMGERSRPARRRDDTGHRKDPAAP